MQEQELQALEQEIEKADNARRKAEDEYFRVKKFFSDKKYAYEKAGKEFMEAESNLNEMRGNSDELRRNLDSEKKNRENISLKLRETEKELVQTGEAVKKHKIKVSECKGASPEMLHNLEKAQQQYESTEQNIIRLKSHVEILKKNADEAAGAVEHAGHAVEEAVNDRLDKIISEIVKGTKKVNSAEDEKKIAGLMIEYGLISEGNIGEIGISDGNVYIAGMDTDMPVYEVAYKEGKDGSAKDKKEYFCSSVDALSGECSVQLVKTIYRKTGAEKITELVHGDDGDFYIIEDGKRTKVETPVVEVDAGYGVAVGGRTRKLLEKTESTENGVINTEYIYDQNAAKKIVKVVSINGSECNICEDYTAIVTGVEKLRENYNIHKDAEERKNAIVKKGYEANLEQLNSSGYKTYRVTAKRQLEPVQMNVAQIVYNNLELYKPEFAKKIPFMTSCGIVDGTDKYQLKKASLQKDLEEARKTAQKAENAVDEENDVIAVAESGLKKYELELKNAKAAVDEAEHERNILLSQLSELDKVLKDKQKEAEACKKEMSDVIERIEKLNLEISNGESGVSNAGSELEDLKILYENAAKEYEKAGAIEKESREKLEHMSDKLAELEKQRDIATGKDASGSEAKKGKLKEHLHGIITAFSNSNKDSKK